MLGASREVATSGYAANFDGVEFTIAPGRVHHLGLVRLYGYNNPDIYTVAIVGSICMRCIRLHYGYIELNMSTKQHLCDFAGMKVV